MIPGKGHENVSLIYSRSLHLCHCISKNNPAEFVIASSMGQTSHVVAALWKHLDRIQNPQLQRNLSIADCHFGLVFQEVFGKSWVSQSISAIFDYFDPI